MIVISNHLSRLFPPPEGAIIRVNLAWYGSVAEARQALFDITEKLGKFHEVYLDYPQGRSKPPVPVIGEADAFALANEFDAVRYFAISNVEKPSTVLHAKDNLPDRVQVVPKIETRKGVMNLDAIALECGIKFAMLDKEDLYIDLKRKPAAFDQFVELARKKAEALGIKLLELQGVVFA